MRTVGNTGRDLIWLEVVVGAVTLEFLDHDMDQSQDISILTSISAKTLGKDRLCAAEDSSGLVDLAQNSPLRILVTETMDGWVR